MTGREKTTRNPENHPPAGVQSVEPEEAKAAGSHHHSQRQALKKNTEGHAAEQHPASPAGQHATGSFTGKK